MALDFSLLSMIAFKKTTTVSEENKVASLSFNNSGIEKRVLLTRSYVEYIQSLFKHGINQSCFISHGFSTYFNT